MSVPIFLSPEDSYLQLNVAEGVLHRFVDSTMERRWM